MNVRLTQQRVLAFLRVLCVLGAVALLVVAPLTVSGPEIVLVTDTDTDPFRDAIERNASVAEIKTILQSDPSLLSRPHFDGLSQLHIAVVADRADLVKLLVEKGLSVDGRAASQTWNPPVVDTKPGETIVGLPPISYAVANGKLNVVQALVECGADTTFRDEYGRSLQDIATQRGDGEIAAFLSKVNSTKDGGD